LSAERTFKETRDREYLEQRLRALTEQVFDGMLDDGHFGCKNVGIKLKSSKFKDYSKRQTLMSPINSHETAFGIAKQLLGNLLEKEKNPVSFLSMICLLILLIEFRSGSLVLFCQILSRNQQICPNP
jgi:nucleotidyltransferase/DNA polymerase involved in DNA repair